MSEDYGTIWVCTCCMLSHANGECCDSDGHGGDSYEPLSRITDRFTVTMGSEHDEECDYPDDCDCMTNTFSWAHCEGCGSRLGGERHAMTLWKD